MLNESACKITHALLHHIVMSSWNKRFIVFLDFASYSSIGSLVKLSESMQNKPHIKHDHSEEGSTKLSCTPDREILRFTPCEKFLSHPRYRTPVAPCVQVFFFSIGCIGRHVISLLSAHVTMTSKRFNSKWRAPRL